MQAVDFGGPESEHNLHLSHAGSNSAAYTPFRHPAIDSSLDPSFAASRNGHAQMSSVHQHQHQPSNQHLLQPDNASLSAGHLPHHQFYGDMSRSSQTPSTPSNASPRFSAISPTSQPKQVATSFVPNDRPPPSRDVSDVTIDDTYAAFILYCNPNFPTTTDTSELTKLFRLPPKSDGTAFSTWTLFELIRRFDSKDIKTWTQLALELGVKPPDIDQGQSTQKVQQYSVRLKVRDTLFLFSCISSAEASSFVVRSQYTHHVYDSLTDVSFHFHVHFHLETLNSERTDCDSGL